jgi:hypothetical protein
MKEKKGSQETTKENEYKEREREDGETTRTRKEHESRKI